jgi:hypothetical protein
MEEYYVFRDLKERTFWPDLSTNGIPLQYYQAYVAMATAYMVIGERELSDATLEQARDFLVVAFGEDILAPAPAPAPSADNPPTPIELPGDTSREGSDG